MRVDLTEIFAVFLCLHVISSLSCFKVHFWRFKIKLLKTME